MPDYHAMQQEAARRAIEMQSRAQKPQVRIDNRKKEEADPAPAGKQKQPATEEKTDLFSVLFQDSERTLLLTLLILLSSEETDPALIFALLYLCL